MILGVVYWAVWRVVWPRLRGFEWVERKDSLRDGTVVMGFEKRMVAETRISG